MIKQQRPIIVGTRGSALALTQSRHVIALLKNNFPQAGFEERIISTSGDTSSGPLLRPGGVDGLFTRKIEEELLAGTVDLAIHSFKDLPTLYPEGLEIAAVCDRNYREDAFVSSFYASPDEMPEGSRIGTSSPRRHALIHRLYPKLRIVPIRGNVETRIRKCESGECDALILARAGLERLNLSDKITLELDQPSWYYAPAQGALAVQIRSKDSTIREIVSSIHNSEDAAASLAERAFCRGLAAGCHVPFGVRSIDTGGTITLRGMVSNYNASSFLEAVVEGSSDEPELLGERLAQTMLSMGADEIMRSLEEVE